MTAQDHDLGVAPVWLAEYIVKVAEEVARKYPGPPGRSGAMGAPGEKGRAGNDAYDKYRWDRDGETLVAFSWKGIEFNAPVPKAWSEEIPQGELSFGDIAVIQMLYGTSVVERIATFWRREYDVHEDMSLFINEEELCSLKDIHQSDLYPAHLKDSWARRFRQSLTEKKAGM